jgi:hypothetical protein
MDNGPLVYFPRIAQRCGAFATKYFVELDSRQLLYQ